jgi:sugar phosphate isomerase/epimerase
VYEIIKLANRPNIGLCFDTFQTFGSEYADPRTDSGLIEHPDISLQKLEESFKDSLTRLTKEVDKDKIYLLQISDAYIPPAPLQDDEAGKEGGLRARGKWSHDFRPYPFNGGAFSAQCVEMVKAVLATGCREGTWFSVEVFDGGETGEGKSVNMESFCRGAMESYRRLLDECASDS